MSVRLGLLAILAQGECYGSQLRSEYARRTGATLNVGQIYTTLDRFERDRLAEKRGVDDHGHTRWGLTAAGRDEVRAWFASADPPPVRDERAAKIALAATLPGIDMAHVVDVEQQAARERRATVAATEPTDAAGRIVRAAELARLDAELAWLAAVPGLADGGNFALASDRPKRGRPARSGSRD